MTTKTCKKCKLMWDFELLGDIPVNSRYSTMNSCNHEWQETITKEELAEKIMEGKKRQIEIINELIPQYYKEEPEMPIKFIYADETQAFNFGQVEVYQFFKDKFNYFCQKLSDDEYVQIADKEGKPYCRYLNDIDFDNNITAIFPRISKIEF